MVFRSQNMIIFTCTHFVYLKSQQIVYTTQVLEWSHRHSFDTHWLLLRALRRARYKMTGSLGLRACPGLPATPRCSKAVQSAWKVLTMTKPVNGDKNWERKQIPFILLPAESFGGTGRSPTWGLARKVTGKHLPVHDICLHAGHPLKTTKLFFVMKKHKNCQDPHFWELSNAYCHTAWGFRKHQSSVSFTVGFSSVAPSQQKGTPLHLVAQCRGPHSHHCIRSAVVPKTKTLRKMLLAISSWCLGSVHDVWGWTRWPPGVPSNPKLSMILWFYVWSCSSPGLQRIRKGTPNNCQQGFYKLPLNLFACSRYVTRRTKLSKFFRASLLLFFFLWHAVCLTDSTDLRRSKRKTVKETSPKMS